MNFCMRKVLVSFLLMKKTSKEMKWSHFSDIYILNEFSSLLRQNIFQGFNSFWSYSPFISPILLINLFFEVE
jgi:hypothetical protein